MVTVLAVESFLKGLNGALEHIRCWLQQHVMAMDGQREATRRRSWMR